MTHKLHSFLHAVKTRQVYNLFQEPVEQPPLGFNIAEEKLKTAKKEFSPAFGCALTQKGGRNTQHRV